MVGPENSGEWSPGVGQSQVVSPGPSVVSVLFSISSHGLDEGMEDTLSKKVQGTSFDSLPKGRWYPAGGQSLISSNKQKDRRKWPQAVPEEG